MIRWNAVITSLSVIGVAPLRADVIQISPQPQNPTNFLGRQTTGVIRPAVDYQFMGTKGTTMTNALSFESASDLAGQALENPFMNFLNYNLPTGWSYTFNKNAVIADNTCPAK